MIDCVCAETKHWKEKEGGGGFKRNVTLCWRRKGLLTGHYVGEQEKGSLTYERRI